MAVNPQSNPALDKWYAARAAALKSRIGDAYSRGHEAYVSPYYARGQWDSSAYQKALADYAERQGKEESQGLNELEAEKAMMELRLALMEQAQQQEAQRQQQGRTNAGWMADSSNINAAMGDVGIGPAEERMRQSREQFQGFLNTNYPYARYGYYGYRPEGFQSYLSSRYGAQQQQQPRGSMGIPTSMMFGMGQQPQGRMGIPTSMMFGMGQQQPRGGFSMAIPTSMMFGMGKR